MMVFTRALFSFENSKGMLALFSGVFRCLEKVRGRYELGDSTVDSFKDIFQSKTPLENIVLLPQKACRKRVCELLNGRTGGQQQRGRRWRGRGRRSRDGSRATTFFLFESKGENKRRNVSSRLLL